MKPVVLTAEHLTAADRHRRIVVNLDTGWGIPGVEDLDPTVFVDAHMDYLTDMDGSQVDSIWWCWGDMNYVPYPSKIVKANTKYQKWLKQGLDPLPITLERSKKQGIEAFYTFRINDSGPGGENSVNEADWGVWPPIKEHPEWGRPTPFWPAPFQHFDFTVEGVRRYKLAAIREVVETYDFDGIEIDWRCGYGSLPFFHKWEHRDHLTAFMRLVREMLQEVAEQRGRPYLFAARVPETVEGCHYDGIDVERWVKENLVDILAVGAKSLDADLDAFGRLTADTHIKLYPSMDDHHRAGGYDRSSLEVYRGAAASYLDRGADGIYVFNWYPVPAILDERVEPEQEKLRRQALCELGSLETLQNKDKTFVTERRGGGGWPDTAEYFYKNSSAFAQLPLRISDDPDDETYVFLQVADDPVGYRRAPDAVAQDVARLELRVLLSDAAAADTPWESRIHSEPVRIAMLGRRDFSEPPARTILEQLRVRINGVILDRPGAREGWLVYNLKPVQLACGSNVVAFKLNGRSPDLHDGITLEKLEIAVAYK
jgi:hypothetical protein